MSQIFATSGRADSLVRAAVGGVVAAIGMFVVLACAMTVGTTREVDARVVRALREAGDAADPVGPRWVEEAARDVTALGGYAFLTLLLTAVVGFLFLGRHRSAGWLVLAATLGGWFLSTAFKGAFARPRPDFVPHLSYATSSSFPSGHAMMATVVYLTLGALLARLVKARWAKWYFVGVGTVLTLLVGASRVYLGVHYPTDVLAGWSAGLAWALTCWLVARHLQRRGTVEVL